jgi:hypothetical protein
MNDTTLHLVLFMAGVIFTAGGFYTYLRLTLKRIIADAKSMHELIVHDIDGLGGVIRTLQKEVILPHKEIADRRYHNLTMSVLVAAPLDKESEITKLLKEG